MNIAHTTKSCPATTGIFRKGSTLFGVRACAGLALQFPQPQYWALCSATDTISLPDSEPRATCEHLVMLSIRSRDVARAEWSNVWRFEHFLQLLDVVNNAFNVHSVSISTISTATVKRYGINDVSARAPRTQ